MFNFAIIWWVTFLSSNAVFIVAHILLDFAIGRRVEELESHELDHAFGSEILHDIRALGLLLHQSEHGSVD